MANQDRNCSYYFYFTKTDSVACSSCTYVKKVFRDLRYFDDLKLIIKLTYIFYIKTDG
jgi:hypothetical protein